MSFFKVRINSFKALATVILFVLTSYLFNQCEDEKAQARSYPQVRTNPVSDITSNGATFSGEIYSLGAEPIIDHGFVWVQGRSPGMSDDRILLGPTGTAGSFSADIKTALAKDVEYTVKSFIKTAEHIVYGLPVSFMSLGSGAPVVTSFEPDSAAWMDTIKISGKNFSFDKRNNLVKLNQTECIVISATDSTLVIEVSALITDLENIVSVEIAGNASVYTNDTLRLILPQVTDFLPKQAYWGDTLHIKAKHIRSFYSKNENSVRLGTFKCEIVGHLTDTSMAVRIPFELPDLHSILSLKINGITLLANPSFELLPSYFTFTPVAGIWGNTIQLNGRFNALPSRNNISFFSDNNYIRVYPENILSTTLSRIIIKVPSDLSAIKSTIVYKADPFTITSTDTFRIPAPVIKSFSPASGSTGTSVTIKGKYFSVSNPGVMFGEILAYVTNVNDSVIIANVPNGLSGMFRISVKARLQTTVSADYFDVTNPRITGVSPLSGTFNDEITITGENLLPANGEPLVNFEGIGATVKSFNSTSIKVLVPIAIDSIPRAITVNTGSYLTTSTQVFVLSPPQITSESPAIVYQGEDITITGTGFNPEQERNAVQLDMYPMAIKSSTTTQIIATIPAALPRGNFGIKVIAGGYSRSTTQTFSFDSQWLRIDAPKIPTTSPYAYYGGMSVYAKSVKNSGYLYSEVSKETYKFDPTDKAFTRLNTTSPLYSYIQVKMGEVVCKDTFYLISGYMNNNNKMWAFDDVQNRWKQTSVVPSHMAGVAFALNNKIYFGLDFYFSSNWFFECDPAGNYLWNRLGDFPVTPPLYFATYFSVGNKGYVVFSDNSVWQFDPDLMIWTRKANFPGPARELAFSFILADKAYMGAGRASINSTEYNDLWEYDPDTDIWVLKTYIPRNRHSAIAFSIGNKAYIGFGLYKANYFQNDLYDFYEYDPNYPSK